MAKSVGIHIFGFEGIFRCYRDNENLKQPFGHMDTLNSLNLFSLFSEKNKKIYRIEV